MLLRLPRTRKASTIYLSRHFNSERRRIDGCAQIILAGYRYLYHVDRKHRSLDALSCRITTEHVRGMSRHGAVKGDFRFQETEAGVRVDLDFLKD
jgi:hypothetical protein